MRVALPTPEAQNAQVFAISGICQRPDFRLAADRAADALRVHLGSAQWGEGEDPYLVVRRRSDDGGAVAVLRVEWEGAFTLLASDDELAEALFRELVEPAAPEEVQRQWTAEADAREMLAACLRLT